MGVFLFLCGLVGISVGVITLIRPVPSLGIRRRSTATAVLLVSAIPFVLGPLWNSGSRWFSLFMLLGLVGIAVGILNLIRPMQAWRITKRATGGMILGGSFVVLVASAAIGGPPQGHAPDRTVADQPLMSSTTAPTSAADPAPLPAAPVPVPVVTEPPLPSDTASGAAPATSQTTSAIADSAGGPAPEANSAASPAAPSGLEEARVVRVVDGDTIEVASASNQSFKVRLIGVNTPETVDPHKPVEPYGPEASAYTKQRLDGQSVRLEYDVEHSDHYGRALAYVWLGRELFNATLVQEGYAQIMTIPPNVKYVDQFHQLQVSAREGKRGMWGMNVQPATATEAPPAPARAAKPAPAPAPDPAPTPAPAAKSGRFAPRSGQCVENGIEYIKGNRNSMIYHPPTGQSYNKTVAEDCFYTGEDAVAAGYRAAKR